MRGFRIEELESDGIGEGGLSNGDNRTQEVRDKMALEW
jgi:hypothetical protein